VPLTVEEKAARKLRRAEESKLSSVQNGLVRGLFYRQVMLLTIALTGFLRLLAGSETLQGPLAMSHMLEVAASSAPLMAVQLFNNRTLGKLDSVGPWQLLDLLNLLFTGLSLLDLLLQLCASQIWKPESEYTLLSKSRVGLSKEKTGEADNSDDIDSHVSDSGEFDSEDDEGNRLVKVGGRGFTRNQLKYFKSKFRSEE
jgi:hypothetical protein